MNQGRSQWQDGRRAWERLKDWLDDAAQLDDGDAALDALNDIGQVRHLLDEAELVAVKVARRHRRSWSEIAVKLGVTRQSAWERWRDLDEPAEPAVPGRPSEPQELPSDIAAGEVLDRTARRLRRRSIVKVPNVIGQQWDEAQQTLRDKHLVGVGPDPDGPPLAALGWPGGVVTDQSPESGARVPAESPVTLWVGRGGGSAGDREPRRPKPDPLSAREQRYETSDLESRGGAVG